jgi:hypothetical protein
MLACVVAVPAIALSGSSWSELVKKLQEFRWPAILNLASASLSQPHDEAPRFSPSQPQGSKAADHIAAPPAPCVTPGSACRDCGNLPVAASSKVVPANFQAPAEQASLPASVSGAVGEGSASAGAEPFNAIQSRLRQLGARYYLLESWGNDRQFYRFYCKMAIGGSPDYTRFFEATNADPVQAMAQVLQQVERWKEGGEGKADGSAQKAETRTSAVAMPQRG